MKKAICTLKGTTPYSQGRYYDVSRLSGELHKDYEVRTWRERMHYDTDDNVFIPPTQFTGAVQKAAQYLSIKVPGKGQSTYTKHFNAGVLNSEPLVLPYKKDEVDGSWVFVPPDGKRGGSKRVHKCFPIIHKWEGVVSFWIMDDIITEDIFTKVLEAAGNLIGIGVYRPINQGYYGRFSVEDLKWVVDV